MKKIILLFLSAILVSSCSHAQTADYLKYFNEENAKKHLTLLTSKSFAGRGTGEPGGKKAAEYIADQFKSYGLIPPVNGSYLQPLSLIKTHYKVETFSIGEDLLILGKDFVAQGQNAFKNYAADEILFVGYGIQDAKYNDLDALQIQDKIVFLINEEEPMDSKGRSLLTGTTTRSSWSEDRFKRVQEILKLKPKMLLLTGKQSTQIIMQMNNRNLAGRFQLGKLSTQDSYNGIPIVFLSEDAGDKLLKSQNTSIAHYKQQVNKTLKPNSFTLPLSLNVSLGNIKEQLQDPNVLGLLEGTDLKEEILVIGGHYDHDGSLPDGTFYPGADDNGSGTVGILELARVFSVAKKEGKGPRRSILFMAFAAEERGLLGSSFYVENPIFPLEKTVACLNIDMIGRIDDKHLNGNHNYIHVIGVNKLSSSLKPIVETANKDGINMELDYSYDHPEEPMRLYYRSDHYNFAKNNIPSLFFFSGLHPHYHTTEDTVDKIDFPMMVKREKLIFNVATEIANQNSRPVVDIKDDTKKR